MQEVAKVGSQVVETPDAKVGSQDAKKPEAAENGETEATVAETIPESEDLCASACARAR